MGSIHLCHSKVELLLNLAPFPATGSFHHNHNPLQLELGLTEPPQILEDTTPPFTFPEYPTSTVLTMTDFNLKMIIMTLMGLLMGAGYANVGPKQTNI